MALHRFLTLTASVLLFAGIAAAQNKVAVINMQQAVLETDEIKKASADLVMSSIQTEKLNHYRN
jgi:Skp family chaperone for outer membrane proteins